LGTPVAKKPLPPRKKKKKGGRNSKCRNSIKRKEKEANKKSNLPYTVAGSTRTVYSNSKRKRKEATYHSAARKGGNHDDLVA